MKLKFPNLLKPLGTTIQQNYWCLYRSELIYFAFFTMRHPVYFISLWWLTCDEQDIYFGIYDWPLVLNTVSILCNVVMMTVWGGENPGRTLSDRWSFVRIDTFSWREISNLHFTTIIFSDFAKTQSKVREIVLPHISYKLYIGKLQ